MKPGSAEHIEHLGSRDASVAERLGAITNCGQCLICGGQWANVEDPLRSCPHDEVQVIAMLRAQLEEARRQWIDPAPGPANVYPWLKDVVGPTIVVVFKQDPDGRWSATASGAAAGSVNGTATQGKALHALAYVLEFPCR